MKSRSSRLPAWLGPAALFVVAGAVLAAVVGLYLEIIPAHLIGRAPGIEAGVQGRADRSKPRIARGKSRRERVAPAPPIAEKGVADVGGDGESPAMSGPQALPKDAEPEAQKTPSMVEYEARARETPDNPVDQKKLALWCEQRALVKEALSHWEAVVRLKPDDETARKRLGYQKRGKKWMTAAMIAEEDEQKKADKIWFAKLNDIHSRMHGPRVDAAERREKAVAELSEVTDPLAAVTLWRVFGGHPQHHLMVARQLGLIRSPKSSRMLAAVAAYSTDEKARSAATEELRNRDPVEFAGPLIALNGPTLTVRQISLPVSPGQPPMKALEIEDERFYRQLVYMGATPPAASSADAFGGGCSQTVRWMNFGWTAEGRQMAREMNQAEARIAQEAADRQLRSDLAAVDALNKEITTRNDRVVSILTRTTRKDLGPDREEWSRWFAGIQGQKYSPPRQVQKITLADFVEPMYRPTFISIPPAPT